MEKDIRPEYEAPKVVTYTEEEILEELGPAQANQYSTGDSVMKW